MTTVLRLDNKEHFKFWNYPGGEVGCELVYNHTSIGSSVNVVARINTAEELLRLISAVDVLKHAVVVDGATLNALTVSYFPYGRQDRREYGRPFLLPWIVGVLDSLGFKQILICDPHSLVTPALFRDTKVYIHKSTEIFASSITVSRYDAGTYCFVAPDAGAAKRANEFAAVLGGSVLQCLKTRNPQNGKIENICVPDHVAYQNYVVVDDICDGGATFIKLAEALDVGKTRLQLLVTHGIFSNNAIPKLAKHYSRIITTDSWQSEAAIQEKADGTECVVMVVPVDYSDNK